MDVPLEMLLKNANYLEIARLQDEVIFRLYSTGTKLIFHGGTSIWRCYNGKRFSYNLNMYIKNEAELNKLIRAFSKYNLFLKKVKERKAGKTLAYYKVSNGKAEITLEFNRKRAIDRVIATYVKVDGSGMDIFTLPPEDLIAEKIAAYKSRRAVKDLYDIFILTHVADTNSTRSEIYRFITDLKAPLDERILPQLIYDGPVPNFSDMLNYIKNRYEIH